MTPTPLSLPRPFNLSDHLLRDRIGEGMGDSVALVVGDRRLTYREVDQAASRAGNLLLERGIGPGDRVLLALPDGVDFVAGLFGILRMGGVAVLVNPHLPAEDVRYFFDYTGGRALFLHRDTAPSFREVAGERGEAAPLLLDVTDPSTRAALDGASPELDTHPTDPEDPAIWLFSGGTTGNPKAVVQPHRSFANTTELYGKGVLGMGPGDVTLSVPKLFFGYATGTNLFFPFSVGATSVLFPERCTVETLFARIAAHRPTVLVNVPTMVNHMVSHPEAGAQDLSSLRLATSAGEALPVELHRRWDETFGVELLDGLGTAEMWHIFLSNRPGEARPGTLGKAVPGFDVRVRDEEGNDLPPGEAGLLWVGGDSLGLGYHERPEQTAHAFRGRWYVSGDMVSMDEEGWVTYCGRADDMLKVSGKWLSPGELESCLLAHPAVKEVAVVGARTPEGLVKPHAWVVPEAGQETGEALVAELQQWARTRLLPYKYPREVSFVEELPRTHLGKVDRGALAGR